MNAIEKSFSILFVAALALAAAPTARAQGEFTPDVKGLLAQAEAGAATVPDAPPAAASEAAQAPEGAQVRFGTVCSSGRNKADALTRLMTSLNDQPYARLYVDLSVWTKAKYTGQYVKAPYRLLGEVAYSRISHLAEYGWLACAAVEGSAPAAR